MNKKLSQLFHASVRRGISEEVGSMDFFKLGGIEFSVVKSGVNNYALYSENCFLPVAKTYVTDTGVIFTTFTTLAPSWALPTDLNNAELMLANYGLVFVGANGFPLAEGWEECWGVVYDYLRECETNENN